MKKTIMTLVALTLSFNSIAGGTCKWVYESQIRELQTQIDHQQEEKGIMTGVVVGSAFFLAGVNVLFNNSKIGQKEAEPGRYLAAMPLAVSGVSLIGEYMTEAQLKNQIEQYTGVVSLYVEAKKGKNNIAKELVAHVLHMKASDLKDDDPIFLGIRNKIIKGYEEGDFCLGGFPYQLDMIRQNILWDIEHGFLPEPGVQVDESSRFEFNKLSTPKSLGSDEGTGVVQ